MKIFVTGTRGIPDIPGGVETHCQHLYPRIAAQGHEIMVCRRSSYVRDSRSEWNGVHLMDLFSPHRKSIEAIVHTTLAILAAKRWGADIIHIHAVGPGLSVPLARLLGMKVVFTNHGPDYERKKWGKTARLALRVGEWLACTYANEIIVISNVIANIVRKRCNRESHLIYNGVEVPVEYTGTDYITSLGLSPRNYLLAVARFVPEKGLHDLIQAFNQLDTDTQLVIAGDADHEHDYSRSLKQMAQANPRIHLTGYITGQPLDELYSHARLFVLPSYHEGLPIALLEALSHGVPALVSDIPANMEVKHEAVQNFRCGNKADLANKISQLLRSPPITKEKHKQIIDFIREKYNWEEIAKQTLLVYINT